jgi:hypothetical protein
VREKFFFFFFFFFFGRSENKGRGRGVGDLPNVAKAFVPGKYIVTIILIVLQSKKLISSTRFNSEKLET